MTAKILPYLLILALLFIVLTQNRSCERGSIKETRDTVIVYKYIHDTIPGKTLPPKIEKDTVWMTRTKFIPDTTYKGLLKQYNFLGNNYFEKRTFSTTFPIADYGTITSIDTVSENTLKGTSLVTELNIPVTTITIEKEAPPRDRLYFGVEATGNKATPINGVYVGPLLKTKKDRIYSLSIGYTGEINYKGALYFPLRIN